MLNELLIVERGARQAGIEMPLRHPDVKDAARKPTLQVFLDSHANSDGLPDLLGFAADGPGWSGGGLPGLRPGCCDLSFGRRFLRRCLRRAGLPGRIDHPRSH